MSFFETSLLEFHRWAKQREEPHKNPSCQAQIVELLARLSKTHAVNQEMRILLKHARIKVFCKSAVFPTATTSNKTMALSVHV